MKRRIFVMASLAAALSLPLSPSVMAEPAVAAKDAKAIQSVVRLQLKALAEDDALKAYSLATPGVQRTVGTPEDFMQIIREDYPPVYRHRRATFSAPELIDGKIVSVVRLTDPDDQVWLAMFEMARINDGSWKIDGCQLLATSNISI